MNIVTHGVAIKRAVAEALTLGIVILAARSVAASPQSELTTEQVRQSVQSSIPFIQERGVWWIDEKKCVSCHRISTMVWSLNTARRNGFEVSDRLDEWINWATESPLKKDADGKAAGLLNKEGVAQLLIGLNRDANTVDSELADLLLDGQQPDGSWKPCGQLPGQKRPLSETAGVSTMWLTLALVNDGRTEQASPAVKLATCFITESPAGKSTEWYALQVLLAAQTGDSASRDGYVDALRAQQQADGGWGWLVGEESDALGTGMALYALIRAGVNSEDPAIERAQRFLVSTQHDDGSWAVRGTKAGKKEHVEETASYWGTTWAALGLMASLSGKQD
ncbi:MAG: prenyltransferase/squalene oxidase repeat-containing protein [Planctomycetaceae bacterium]